MGICRCIDSLMVLKVAKFQILKNQALTNALKYVCYPPADPQRGLRRWFANAKVTKIPNSAILNKAVKSNYTKHHSIKDLRKPKKIHTFALRNTLQQIENNIGNEKNIPTF